MTKERDSLRQQLAQSTSALALVAKDKTQVQAELETVRASYRGQLEQEVQATVGELRDQRTTLAATQKQLADAEEQLEKLKEQVLPSTQNHGFP